MNRHMPFHERPLNWRKKCWIRTKNRIRSNKYGHRGLFYTWHELQARDPSEGRATWCDFYFLSSVQKNVFYNATISIAQNKLWDEAHTIAFNKAYDQLTEEERENEFRLEFEVYEKSPLFGQKMYQLKEKAPVRYDVFEGRTFSDEVLIREQEVLSSKEIQVYEEFSLDHSYAYGVGLEMVVDSHEVTVDVIEQAINKFLSNGEKPFRGFSPVPEERLVYQTRKSLRSK